MPAAFLPRYRTMQISWHDPLVQTLLLPLMVSVLGAGLLWAAGGRSRGPRLAAAALALAVLAAVLSVNGLPPLPPRASSQKLAYLLGVAAVVGLALDLVGVRRRLVIVTAGLYWCASIVWLAGNRLSAMEPAFGALLAASLAAALLLAWQFGRLAAEQVTLPLVALGFAAAGLGGVVVLGGSASIAQIAFALAVAVAGLFIWNWPRGRFEFAASAMLAGVGAWLWLAAQALFFTGVSYWALALLLMVPFMERIQARLLPCNDPRLRPVLLLPLCFVPCAAALALAYLGAGDAPPW